MGDKQKRIRMDPWEKDDDEGLHLEFHGGDIIATLEGLHTDFKNTKTKLDEAEVEAKKEYHKLVQDKKAAIDEQNTAMNDAKKTKNEKAELIASTSKDLSIVASQLLDDQQYLNELHAKCSSKAVLWDQRIELRQ